jgi:hypothetical protein
VILTDCTINSAGAGSAVGRNNRGVESDHEGSTLNATDTTIDMEGSHQVGAFVHANLTEPGGGVMSLTNCSVLLTGDDGYGYRSNTVRP